MSASRNSTIATSNPSKAPSDSEDEPRVSDLGKRSAGPCADRREKAAGSGGPPPLRPDGDSRVCADAITHDQPYRHGVPADAAREEIRASSGRDFDPELVDLFLLLDLDEL